jgi:sugar/nucleoside kinase (ribokinase family)
LHSFIRITWLLNIQLKGVAMDVIVFGNVTLDVICYPVNEVPRHESIAFDQVTVSPGGCGSNTAIGLAAMGIKSGIVACTGDDDAADLLFRYWKRMGLDLQFVRRVPGTATGTSIGLIDDEYQPRFIHTSGANRGLSAESIDAPALAAQDTRFFHIAGFFVLPNLFEQVAEKLTELQNLGITTSLDVVHNVRMDDPALRGALWAALPALDYFIANEEEAARLTGKRDYREAAETLRKEGARNVIVKLGALGCYGLCESYSGTVPATNVAVVDTTGAGDAFAAGFIAALSRGEDDQRACQAGNLAGAKICTRMGAITAWLEDV